MAPPVCGSCCQILGDGYYASRELTLCGDCAKGLKPAQLLKAALYGLVAAVMLGAANVVMVRIGVLHGAMIGLLASGGFIGISVSKGSGNRGGGACQIMAMALTSALMAAVFLARPESPQRAQLVIFGVGMLAVMHAWFFNVALRFEGPKKMGPMMPPPGAGV